MWQHQAGLLRTAPTLLHSATSAALQATWQPRLAPLAERFALRWALRGMAVEAHDELDRFLHAIEFGEGGIDADRTVHEDAAKARIPGRVDKFGFANRGKDALGGAGIGSGIVPAKVEIGLERHLARLSLSIELNEISEDVSVRHCSGLSS